MKTTTSIKALFGAAALATVAAQSASAQFANGDLILSFQATSGQGSTSTVAANLGAGYSFRDLNSNSLNIINIGSLLSSTYGSGWYDRTDLFFSINGNFANGFLPGINNGSPVVNGDARNTIYVGRSKTDGNVGSYNQYVYTASSMDGVGTLMQTYNATVTTALSSSSSATIPTSTASTIEDFTSPDGGSTVNFGVFSPDFNQAFSAGTLFSKDGVDYQGALGLQRINRTDVTTGALSGNIVIPGITAGSGSNEGMFAITDNGQVDFYAVPEPSTYALLALAAAGLGAHVIRRRRRCN